MRKRRRVREILIIAVYLGCLAVLSLVQVTMQVCYGDLIVVCSYFRDICYKKFTVLRVLHKTLLPRLLLPIILLLVDGNKQIYTREKGMGSR